MAKTRNLVVYGPWSNTPTRVSAKLTPAEVRTKLAHKWPEILTMEYRRHGMALKFNHPVHPTTMAQVKSTQHKLVESVITGADELATKLEIAAQSIRTAVDLLKS